MIVLPMLEVCIPGHLSRVAPMSEHQTWKRNISAIVDLKEPNKNEEKEDIYIISISLFLSTIPLSFLT